MNERTLSSASSDTDSRRYLTGRRAKLFGLLVLLSLAATCTVGIAADIEIETVLSNLHSPMGLAVRPETSNSPPEVFIAERGAGRVVRWTANGSDATDEIIHNLPTALRESKSDRADTGVRTLIFLDHDRLVVAGSRNDGIPALWLYDLMDTDAALAADDRKQEVAPLERSAVSKATGYVALARTLANDRVANSLYAVVAGGDTGALWRVPLRANTLGEEAVAIGRTSNTELIASGGIAVSKEGYIVVASHDDKSQYCTLKYVNPLDSRTVLEVPTKLREIVALAFNPKTGNLFAANLESLQDGGGIYRIDDASEPGHPRSNAKKISPAEYPTGLAFSTDGSLYATALGDSRDDKTAGTLLRLSGDL